MKFFIQGQEKVTSLYRWLLNRGDCMGRFDCLFCLLITYVINFFFLGDNSILSRPTP
jgi:hypothetical protein